MNIVEAYIKFKGQMVILISGMSGSGITHLGKNISKDLNLSLISYRDYFKEDYDKKIKLPNDTEIINWDSDDIIDWDNFIQAIKGKSHSGVVAYSQSFPTSKLDELVVDFHINIKLSKQNLLSRRKKYAEKHDEEFGSQETMILNNYTYPYYLQSVSNSKITKFINANEFNNLSDDEYDEKIADESFNYLMNIIKKWIDNYHKTMIN